LPLKILKKFSNLKIEQHSLPCVVLDLQQQNYFPQQVVQLYHPHQEFLPQVDYSKNFELNLRISFFSF